MTGRWCRLTRWEFWPPWLFYPPVLFYVAGLMLRYRSPLLFTASNPAIPGGGFVAESKGDGETVWDRLARLYETHGLWVSTQKSIVRPGAEGADEIAAAMALLAERTPDAVGGLAVQGVADYRLGAEERPRYLAATPLVELSLGDAGRALIRPSGTEPKLKIYVDLVAARDQAVTAEEQEEALVGEADDVAAAIADQLGL